VVKLHIHELELFKNISPAETETLLKCINAHIKTYKKDEFIIEAGNPTSSFGIIIKGAAHSIKWDESGKVTIITMVEKGGTIGVLLAAKPARVSPLAVQATTETTVILFPFKQVLMRCEKNCPHHEQLLQNYIGIIAEKGLELHERINCLLEPTVRQKVLTYLQKISHEKKSREFSIPLSRNIMADYLNVERSALSRELSRMKRDGIIDYNKNNFKIRQNT
jgi:CRP-like cAMP-binding protein